MLYQPMTDYQQLQCYQKFNLRKIYFWCSTNKKKFTCQIRSQNKDIKLTYFIPQNRGSNPALHEKNTTKKT
jgi:hypothetical protein